MRNLNSKKCLTTTMCLCVVSILILLVKTNVILYWSLSFYPQQTKQCNETLSSQYNKTVGESYQGDIFHYDRYKLACLQKIDDRLWMRTKLPDFRNEAPSFTDNRSEYLFYKNSENTNFLKIQPMPAFTEVLFLRNGTYKSDKFCGYKGASDWIMQTGSSKRTSAKYWYPVLAPVVSFDGFSFQHFLDGTIHLLVQILPLVQDGSVHILTYEPRDNILFEFMAKLNISKRQLVFFRNGVTYHADLMVYSCVYDRLHPMLWHQVRTRLGVKNTLSIEHNKALVVVITRDGCFNCGRRLLNQDKIVGVLRKRYGNDTVKVFKGPKTLDETLDLFSKSRIILGPHSGGLYNMVFAPYGTTIIEYMPTTESGDTGMPGHQIFWKIANNLRHSYWRVAIKPEQNKNMNVDLNHLEKLLDLVDKKT